jgi:hypothetical protein
MSHLHYAFTLRSSSPALPDGKTFVRCRLFPLLRRGSMFLLNRAESVMAASSLRISCGLP